MQKLWDTDYQLKQLYFWLRRAFQDGALLFSFALVLQFQTQLWACFGTVSAQNKIKNHFLFKKLNIREKKKKKRRKNDNEEWTEIKHGKWEKKYREVVEQ